MRGMVSTSFTLSELRAAVDPGGKVAAWLASLARDIPDLGTTGTVQVVMEWDHELNEAPGAVG